MAQRSPMSPTRGAPPAVVWGFTLLWVASAALGCGAKSSLHVPDPIDAGMDAAVDAGEDAGVDAGVVLMGPDSGPPDPRCADLPSSRELSPTLEWRYDSSSVTMPLVVQLTDDDGDGVIGEADVPDIVILDFDSVVDGMIGMSCLTALSGDDGELLWRTCRSDLLALVTPAAADLDGDGTVEIVLPFDREGVDMHVGAFSHQGELEWASPPLPFELLPDLPGDPPMATSIADLDGDGSPEILVGDYVLSSEGEVLLTVPVEYDHPWLRISSLYAIADVDLDGRMEVVTAQAVYNHDGSALWRGGTLTQSAAVAVARVIEDPRSAGPQIIAVDGRDLEILDGATGEPLAPSLRYATLTDGIGSAGPPMVADVDADGRPEIGVPGENDYVLFDFDDSGRPYVRWSVPSLDATIGSVSSTAFDFDGDGAAEVIYADERSLRIFDGRTGEVLFEEANTSGTVREYPVVADVDADGHAEIVVVSNSFEGSELPSHGVRVFGDRRDRWPPTGSIWNQHHFHLDNVRADGSIPRVEERSWETHNTYRVNTLICAVRM